MKSKKTIIFGVSFVVLCSKRLHVGDIQPKDNFFLKNILSKWLLRVKSYLQFISWLILDKDIGSTLVVSVRISFIDNLWVPQLTEA